MVDANIDQESCDDDKQMSDAREGCDGGASSGSGHESDLDIQAGFSLTSNYMNKFQKQRYVRQQSKQKRADRRQNMKHNKGQ